jgi:hypothetical protein
MDDIPRRRQLFKSRALLRRFPRAYRMERPWFCECLRIAWEAIESDYMRAGRRGSRSGPAAKLLICSVRSFDGPQQTGNHLDDLLILHLISLPASFSSASPI